MSNMNHLWDGTKSSGMTLRPDGAAIFKRADRQFTIQAPPEGILLAELPALAVRAGLDTYNALADATERANADLDLSDAGRANRLRDPQQAAIRHLATLAQNLQVFRRGIDQRETQLFALPPLNLNAVALDIESRAWFYAQPDRIQADVLAQACKSAGGADAIAPLLRGPFPEANPRIVMITQMWQAARIAACPTEAEAIADQREAADWAYVQLALLASMTVALCKTWGAEGVLTFLLDPKNADVADAGYALYGISEKDIKRSRTTLANRMTAAMLDQA